MPTSVHVRSVLLAVLSVATGAAQAQVCPFSLGADTAICAGASVTLNAPAGAYNVLWNTGSTGNSITTDTSGTFWCQATFLQGGNNLVVNGDFTLGTLGFTSDLLPGGGGVNGPLTDAGTFGVSADPNTLNNTFAPCTDHTGGGPMLVVNGGSTFGLNTWCTTVNVQPNTDYIFSLWLMSIDVSGNVDLGFSFNGSVTALATEVGGTVCEWHPFFTVWNSGASTSVTICLNDQSMATSGNDYALDDIGFTPLCVHRDSIEVTALPATPPQVLVTQEGGLCPGEDAMLHAGLDPAGTPDAGVDYLWSTQETGRTIHIDAPGLYDVTLTSPCWNTQGSILVLQDTCSASLTMPNVFTPNDDGVNDTFGPIVVGAPTNYAMDIRNRWGAVVYHSELLGDRWTGRATGIPVPEGTYFWVVRYSGRTIQGAPEDVELAGYVTLRR